jgi:hypothetical protein
MMTGSRTKGMGGFGTSVDLKQLIGSVKDLGTVNQSKISNAVFHSVPIELQQTSGLASKIKNKKAMTDKENVKKQLDLTAKEPPSKLLK